MTKVLLIRFSSIGDIVLTSPVIRSLKQARPEIELHFATKRTYQDLLIANPYVDKLHLLEASLITLIKQLRAERYDYILDLHNNIRTRIIKTALMRPYSSFNKENSKKYRLVRNKKISTKIDHVVKRYGNTLDKLNIELDNGGLEFHLTDEVLEQAKMRSQAFFDEHPKVLGVVLGANYATKRWVTSNFPVLLNQLNWPVVLLGGNDALNEADFIRGKLKIPYLDLVGKESLLVAAAIMKNCEAVFTHDTGFMHIAAAFKQKVFSIWGSTVPALGMTPYKTESYIIENTEIGCRPCSKIGFGKCPKGHFNCMKTLTPDIVLKHIQENI